MSLTKLRFHFREPTVDTNRPISEGIVKVEGFELQVVSRLGDADAWDCGFGALMQSKAKGARDISIPAFPNRKFRLSYIYVNSAAGIESPRDLEGKRVGILFWGNTAGVWARGALQHHYGVDLKRINWFALNNEGVESVPGIRIESLGRGANLDSLLAAGELEAVIFPDILPSITRRDPRVCRLFRDYKTEEQNYFKQTGIFPISHVVTLHEEFVTGHPHAPAALLKAFRQARDIAIDNIQGSDPQVLVVSWINALMEEQRALMGENYFAYNIEANRRSLDAMTQYSYEQGLTPKKYDYETFFAPEAVALPGM